MMGLLPPPGALLGRARPPPGALLGSRRLLSSVPHSARAIVVGGGVVGTSVAYNLARLGFSDVVLLEKSKLTSGTTWHAAGLVGQLRGTKIETLISAEAVKVYGRLEEETGLATGFKQCGSLTTAQTADRFEVMKRNAARARSYGLEAELLTPRECGDMMTHDNVNLLRTDDLVGGLWLPGDGSGSPTDLTMSFAAGARKLGVSICEGVGVKSFRTAALGGTGVSKVLGVETDDGHVIECEQLVLCTGQWSRQLGATAGVSVPLHSCEHFYVTTNTMPGVHPGLPVYRDNDSYTYFREWGTGMLVGGFEAQAKPIWTGGVPADFAFSLLPDDQEHFIEQIWEGAAHRIPSLEHATINSWVNGPESFTPDNQYILGEAPECRGFFVAAGFNSAGIANAAGAGILTAEWMANGHPGRDVWGVDIRRFASFHSNPTFLRDRCAEVLGLHYQMPWPRRELASARGMRKTPLYGTHAAGGAVFGQKFGWERVNYFVPPEETPAATATARAAAAVPTVATRPNWLAHARREHLHTRSKVSLFDVSSFAKTLISGADALALLQSTCCADMAMDLGGGGAGAAAGPPDATAAAASRVVYTGMLNEHSAGYEADVTVMRVAADSFLMVSPTAQATRDADHLRRHVPAGADVAVSDVSGSYSVLALMGPHSRELLRRLTTTPLDDVAFPFGTSRRLFVGHVATRAARVTYVGELGYEFYVAPDAAASLYEALHAAAKGEWKEVTSADGGEPSDGSRIELRDGGYYAIDSLRVEAGYRAWGHELGVSDTPLEAGLGFTVAWGKPFVGRAKLLEQKEEPSRRTSRLITLHVADDSLPIWGSEPILRDGVPVGNVTSAAYAHSVGGQGALGYVSHPDAAKKGFVQTGTYHIDVGGTWLEATASLKPLVDAKRRVQGFYA